MTLLHAALSANTSHQQRIMSLVKNSLHQSLPDSRIGVLGVTFKAGTRDLRDSPSWSITLGLAEQGAHVRAYDPAIPGVPSGLITERAAGHLTVTASPDEALQGCDLALLLTDWPEFDTLDWFRIAGQMRGQTVLDTRTQLDPTDLAAAGLLLHSTAHLTSSDTFTAFLNTTRGDPRRSGCSSSFGTTACGGAHASGACSGWER